MIKSAVSAQLRSRGWAFHPFSSNAGKTKYVYSIYGDVFQRERLESKAREERLSESVDILHSRLQREISRRELLEEKIKMVRGHLCKGFQVLSMELIEGGKEGFRGWGRELREGEPSPPDFLHHCSTTKLPFCVSSRLEHGIPFI